MSTATSRGKHRYVGAPSNTEKLSKGYTADTRQMDLGSIGQYRESIRDVLSNLNPLVTIEDGVFTPDLSAPLPGSELGPAFKFRGTCYPFNPTLLVPTNSSGPVAPQYASFMLAIAQCLVLTFNQLSVDLDDRPDPPSMDIPTYLILVRKTCNATVSELEKLVNNPKVVFGDDIIFGSVVAGVDPIKLIVNELNTLCTPEVTLASVDQIITIKRTPVGDAVIPDITIDMSVIDGVSHYVDRIIYNANIAAAVLAAKKGTPAGIAQLTGLKTVLDNFSDYRKPLVLSGGSARGDGKRSSAHKKPSSLKNGRHLKPASKTTNVSARFLGTSGQVMQQALKH